MNKTLKNILVFTAGSVCGAAVSFIGCKYVSDKQLEKALQSQKETYENYINHHLILQNNSKPDLTKELLTGQGDISESETMEILYEKKLPEKPTDIEIIEPNEYGLLEEDGYIGTELTLFADGVLVDNLTDRPVENVEELLGDTMSSFGMYEEDALHVRNHTYKLDIEVLKTERMSTDDVGHCMTERSYEDI